MTRTVEELEENIRMLLEDCNRKSEEIERLRTRIHSIKYLSPGVQLNIELTSGFERGIYGFTYHVSREALKAFKGNPEKIIADVQKECIMRIIEYADKDGNKL